MTRSTLPALLCLAALTLTGCGSDVLPAPPLPEPTSSSTLLDLPSEDETENPTEETTEDAPTSGEAITGQDASVVISAISQRSAQAPSVWIGRKEGKAAVKTLEVSLDPSNRVQIAANILGATFVCVEAKDGSAFTFTTVVGAEDASSQSGETECPSAATALVESLREHVADDDALAAKEKERRRKQRDKDKADQETADAEMEAAETAERLASVQTDASSIATMLTEMLAQAPKGPRKPGEPADIRDYDTVPEVAKVLSTSGVTLGEGNTIGAVTKMPTGFIVCVEMGDAGPSATHNGITGKTLTVEDSGCA